MKLFFTLLIESLIFTLFQYFINYTGFYYYGGGFEFMKIGYPLALFLFFFLAGYINTFFIKEKSFFASGAISILLMVIIVFLSGVFLSVYFFILGESSLPDLLTSYILIIIFQLSNYFISLIGLLLGVFINLYFYRRKTGLKYV